MKTLPRREEVSAVLRFLRSRRSYPEHPRRVQVLQTHASWVAITTWYVYKVKKPVDFGFLDFSTLEKRRHFCEREMLLNQRLSADVYVGVIPIRRRGRSLAFNGDGEIAEYAVKMRRLPARYFLLRILREGRLTRRHVDRLIAILKPFYSQSTETKQFAKWGSVARLREGTGENFRQTKTFLGNTISRSAWEAIRTFTGQFYRGHGPLFRARARGGKIRDCHGDLHLEHIHMAPDKVSIYDCIEFNDRFRLIDVASDLAFLAMDLDFHARADLGEYLMARMAMVLRDPEMLRVLDFYKCYRAFVRGKVESFHGTAPGVGGREQVRSLELARHYFRLALKYSISGSKPMALIVMGRVATGKSTLARLLADELNWKVFSSDGLRKELAGVPLRIRGSKAERAHLYSQTMSDRTYAALARCAVSELRRGQSVILDATFASHRRRDGLRAKLKRIRADYCFIETEAARSTVRRRLAARENATNEISDARLEDLRTLESSYEPPEELDRTHYLPINTRGAAERVLSGALQALARRRASFLT